MGIPSKIIISGKVFIKYIDDTSQARPGDVLLYLNDDSISANPGDYDTLVLSGYIKAGIFDGMVWQNIDITEFCTDRENKFAKKHRAIDSAVLCRGIMELHKSVCVFKTYRGHFTRYEYEQGEYHRKANRRKK